MATLDDTSAEDSGASADPPISNLAVVAPDTLIGEGVRIGPFTVVGRDGDEHVEIGSKSIIADYALIEPGVRIGPGSSIGSHCRIGRGSLIAAGSILRSGNARSNDTKFKHSALRHSITSLFTPLVSPQALVAKNVTLGPDVSIGPFAIIGWEDERSVQIGARTEISPFALIEPGVTIGEDCFIDAYCRICAGTTIGSGTRILYGAAIFEHASVGRECIVGGNVADRTIIEDYVTFFGEIAHDYRKAGSSKDWDEVEAPSPRIRKCTVVGQGAVIIGGLDVGEGSYIAAGEVVRVDVPAKMFVSKGQMKELSKLRGWVRARTDGECA